jgi:hypothetical protein
LRVEFQGPLLQSTLGIEQGPQTLRPQTSNEAKILKENFLPKKALRELKWGQWLRTSQLNLKLQVSHHVRRNDQRQFNE